VQYTHPATKTPKIKVTMAKSNRSRAFIWASGDFSEPNIARTRDDNDGDFLEPEYATEVKDGSVKGWNRKRLTGRGRGGCGNKKHERNDSSGDDTEDQDLKTFRRQISRKLVNIELLTDCLVFPTRGLNSCPRPPPMGLAIEM